MEQDQPWALLVLVPGRWVMFVEDPPYCNLLLFVPSALRLTKSCRRS